MSKTCVLWLAGVSWAVSSHALATTADLQAYQQRGSLRVLVVFVESEPEFFDLRPAGPPGFDHEILQGFASLHGLKLEPLRVEGWDQLAPALLEGRGDLIAGRYTVTEARRRLLAFSVPVLPTRDVLVSRAPRPAIDRPALLRRARIGVVGGSSLVESLLTAGVPRLNVIADIPPGGSLAALRQGRYDAVALELAEALLAQHRDPELRIGLPVGVPAAYAYAVRKSDRGLLAALDDYLSKLRRTPSWSRLVAKYFGSTAPAMLERARP